MRNVTFGLNSGRTTLSGRSLRWPRWYLDGWWSKLVNWPWIYPQPPGIDADELKVLISFWGGVENQSSFNQVYHSLYFAMFVIVLVTWLSLLVSLSYSFSYLVLKLWPGDPAGISSDNKWQFQPLPVLIFKNLPFTEFINNILWVLQKVLQR